MWQTIVTSSQKVPGWYFKWKTMKGPNGYMCNILVQRHKSGYKKNFTSKDLTRER